MHSQLVYSPLADDEIRLLTLLPAASLSAPLKLQLFHSNVHSPHVSYAALSYTWASKLEGNHDSDVELHESVDVDGHEVLLHQNLALALRSLRLDVPQCLWADALCIDQSNTAERSIQVMLMRRIFSKATNVWAWLGPAAKDSDLAMDFLTYLAEHSEEEHIGAWLGNEGMQPSYYPTWEALRALMSRNWWKRAWIVQEFALAQDVVFICGDRRLSSNDLEKADHLIFEQFTPSRNERVTALTRAVDINPRVLDPARNLLNLRRRLQRGERISALATVQMTRLTEATDPRDHLFAKLGLSGNEIAELCPPDYVARPEDVWFTFLSEYIKQKQDLYIICLAGMHPRIYQHLPSWLPDWGPSKPQYMLCSLFSGDRANWPAFDAASGSKPVATISTSKLEARTFLESKGLEVDVVDGVAGDPWWTERPSSLRQSQFAKNAYNNEAGAFEALLRTVTSNTNRLGFWTPPPPEFRLLFAKRWRELGMSTAAYELDSQQEQKELPLPFYPRASGFERAWRSMRHLQFAGLGLHQHVEAFLARSQSSASSASSSSSETDTTFDFSAPAPSHSLWTALEHSAGQACYERFVFTTREGRLGLGPSTAEPGDKIVVLLGCDVPVLLRPLDEGYRLVGECYVDGVMYGEMTRELGQKASDSDSESLLPLKSFVLY